VRLDGKKYVIWTVIYIAMKTVILSIGREFKEFAELAKTLDMDINKSFIQKRKMPHRKFFVGEGKFEEISGFVKDNDIKTVLINGIVKPSQHYNIENGLGVECIDRIGLILKIFKMRAESQEAKLQIEHARLKYEIPLLREWIHRSKSREHPGFLAGGEYRIDVYYDLVKRRVNKIGKLLDKIRADRKIKRSYRRKKGYTNITLVGYTNAGKSSLFNILTRSDVFVDENLFSTLSTTSRRVAERARTIILTDTIGFIGDMPHWLIESFQPTLEEIRDAECLLWIFDGLDTEKDILRKFRACNEVLNMTENPIIIPILNKADLLDKEDYNVKKEKIRELIGKIPNIISSRTLFGIDDLIKKIIEETRLPIRIQIVLKNAKETQAMISWMFNTIDVINVNYGRNIVVEAWCRKQDPTIIKSRFDKLINKIEILS